jgi:hypothetical protein
MNFYENISQNVSTFTLKSLNDFNAASFPYILSNVMELEKEYILGLTVVNTVTNIREILRDSVVVRLYSFENDDAVDKLYYFLDDDLQDYLNVFCRDNIEEFTLEIYCYLR